MLSATGYGLWVTGYRSPATGNRLPTRVYKNDNTNKRINQPPCYRLPDTGNLLPITDKNQQERQQK
jgi:hypothetical protein